MIVPEFVPLAPDVIASQLPEVIAAVQLMVPIPVLETLNDVVPAFFPTTGAAGDTESAQLPPTCVTVTSLGVLVPPWSVMRMVAIRDSVLVFEVYAQVTVPEWEPAAPDVIVSQLLSVVFDALQLIVPEPVLETLKVVVPDSLLTLLLAGVTDRNGRLPV